MRRGRKVDEPEDDLEDPAIRGSRSFLTVMSHSITRRAAAWALAMAAALAGAGGALAQPPTASATVAPEREPGEPFDPLNGVDPSGRIPRAELPADLPNPDRWRYIPEGRLKPGNFLERFLVSSFVAPFVFRDSDVGTGGGLSFTDIDFREQRRQEFAGVFLSYTTKGQQSYSALWQRWLHHRELSEGGVLQEERSRVRVYGGYSKSLTRRFFGFGAGSDEDDESSYTDEVFELKGALEYALPDPGGNWVVTLGASGELHRLGGGEVHGEPDTKQAYPRTFDAARDADLGWAEAGLRWDTRDSQILPYTGWMVAAFGKSALVQTDGDVGLLYGLEVQRLIPLPGLLHAGGDADEEHPPTDSLALDVSLSGSAGNLPFFALPSLGGAYTHRGYITGRFRDDASWYGVAEYRFWVLPRGFRIPFSRTLRVERVGLAPFYEIGSVAGDVPRLFEARVRHSYGIGLRATLERLAPFRVDVGFSEEGAEVTARFGLSF
jgi:hypothetical protein